MRIVRHELIPDQPSFRAQWNALVHSMERPEVFYTFEWARAVARAYAPSLKPLLLAAYRGDELTGVIAFVHDAGRRQVSFLTASTADYCDFISAPADRREFIEAAMKELQQLGIASVSLANLPADSLSSDAMQSAVRKVGYSMFSRPAYVCAQVPLDSEEKRIQTRKSARNKLRRMSNATAGHGEFAVRHVSGWDEFTSEFPEFAAAHVQRFLAAGRISNLVCQERRAFLLELGKLLSEQGWLTFSTLKFDGRTIAWNYGFRFGGNWFWYQPAFDREMGHLSPGTYLLCEILRQASEDPQIHTVDLGLGDEEYKERYSKAGRLTLQITASSPRRKALEVCRYRTAQLVKRSPRLEHGIRGGLAKLQSVARKFSKHGLATGIKICASRSIELLAGANEVLFFEGTATHSQHTGLRLQPLSFKLLAAAAINYAVERESLDYISRAAQRLNSGGAEGFALTSSAGVPAHFCWVSQFHGFKMSELRQVLEEPAPGCVLLFDCWTPLSQRGQGYYGLCIGKVAGLMLEHGKRPWIFSAANNASSLHGIEKGGFILRFSLKRETKFLVTTISKINLGESGGPPIDLYPAA